MQPFLTAGSSSHAFNGSDETVVDLDDSADYHGASSEKGGYAKVAGGQGQDDCRSGYLTWEDRKARRGRGSRTCIFVLIVLVVGLGGWMIGLATQDGNLRSTVGDGVRNAVLQQKPVKLYAHGLASALNKADRTSADPATPTSSTAC